jgi:UDP-N-acetylglucosamine:LPS N-acetylglucosamine transferase
VTAASEPTIRVPRCFLVLSASMGSGHDTVAVELTRRLEGAGHQVINADVLDLLPAGLGTGLRTAYRTVIDHVPSLYAAVYRAFFHEGTMPRPSSAPLATLAAGGVLGLVERHRVDVVVAVFHLAAQVAGRLRERGELRVPSAVVMTEFAPHRQWLHAGNDLYLCHAEEIAARIRRALGRPAVGCGPLVDSRFGAPLASGTACWRSRLSRDGRPIVLLSTGAWGIGSSLARTASLLDTDGYVPVVLCGSNRRLHRALSARPGITALPWVDNMPTLMAASAALVDNAAGQTALQALAAGLPVIGYRPIPGHGADGVRHMAELGLSDFAADERELLGSVRALTAPGRLRERRIAVGRAFFADDAIYLLETLRIRAHALAGRTTR